MPLKRTTCHTAPFQPHRELQEGQVVVFRTHGKLRIFLDNGKYLRGVGSVPEMDCARTLFCGKPDAVDDIQRVCKVLSRPSSDEPPNYIIVEQHDLYYLFGLFDQKTTRDGRHIVLEYQWMPLSLVFPDACYFPTKQGEEVVYASSRGEPVAVSFEIRKHTLQSAMVMRQTAAPGDARWLEQRIWGFDTLPTLDEAIRQERVQRLLQFRTAKRVKDSRTFVADAAIIGGPLEFDKQMKFFTKQRDWQKIPILPLSRFLTEEQKAAGPQVLSKWIQKGTCLKLLGDEGYHDMIDTLMRYM